MLLLIVIVVVVAVVVVAVVIDVVAVDCYWLLFGVAVACLFVVRRCLIVWWCC